MDLETEFVKYSMLKTLKIVVFSLLLCPATGSAGRDAVELFDNGVSQYKKKDFPEAAEAFESAQASASGRRWQARSAYNTGNALFRQGKIEKAVEKYKQALRLDPKDMDAKHNLEFAQKLVAAQCANKEKSKDDKGSKGDKNPQKTQADQKQGEPLKKAPKPKEGMSKEDAERLLQAMENQEREARRKVRRPEPEKKHPEQDW